MPVESVFPQLEAVLPGVQKPIQYVGGELNSTVKDWDACDVRWALMYPDAYEVGLPNQGVMILYEVLNEREGVLAERTYSVWPDMEKAMREHGVPQFTVDAHRPVERLRPVRRLLLHRAGLHEHAHRPRPGGHPAGGRGPRRRTHPVVIAGGHAAFNPEPIADFIDAAVIGDGEQAGAGDHRHRPRLEGRGPPRRARRSCCCAWPRTGGVYVPRFYDVDYLPDGRIQPGRAEPARRAVPRGQAHRHGPGRVALPEAAAGPAGRDRARAHVAWRSSAAAPAAAGSARPG